jgi:hypothetical protein
LVLGSNPFAETAAVERRLLLIFLGLVAADRDLTDVLEVSTLVLRK